MLTITTHNANYAISDASSATSTAQTAQYARGHNQLSPYQTQATCTH